MIQIWPKCAQMCASELTARNSPAGQRREPVISCQRKPFVPTTAHAPGKSQRCFRFIGETNEVAICAGYRLSAHERESFRRSADAPGREWRRNARGEEQFSATGHD